MPSDQRVLLEEVADEATLSCLSSRHLKDLLAYNFVSAVFSSLFFYFIERKGNDYTSIKLDSVPIERVLTGPM